MGEAGRVDPAGDGATQADAAPEGAGRAGAASDGSGRVGSGGADADGQPIRAHWHNTRGETFHLTGWSPSSLSRTLVLVHHGLGEHAGRYDRLARRLTGGAAVWGYDLRGHGRSDGTRGDAEGLGQLAEDLEVLIPVLLERSGCERVVLLGHSLGAASVAWYLTTRDPHPAIVGAMLSAPPVRVARTPAVRIKAAAARLLVRVAPRLVLSSELDPSHISSVPAEVERYLADPLVHDRLSVRLGWSLLTDAPRIPARAGRVRLPVLLWHGADDGIALAAGSRELAAALPEVEHHEIPAARHEVHHERPDIVDALYARIDRFLDRFA